MPENLRVLEARIGYSFRDQSLLKEAVTHDSLKGVNIYVKHYERLEFLGDSVIQWIISDHLFRTNPEDTEGDLSTKRARLVGKNKQMQIANELDLKSFISLGTGVISFSRWDKFLESLIGAIYKDAGSGAKGLDETTNVVLRLWKLEEPSSTICSLL